MKRKGGDPSTAPLLDLGPTYRKPAGIRRLPWVQIRSELFPRPTLDEGDQVVAERDAVLVA